MELFLGYLLYICFILFPAKPDGVVKSPISCVVGFLQTLDVPHVLLCTFEIHYALYGKLLKVCAYRT